MITNPGSGFTTGANPGGYHIGFRRTGRFAVQRTASHITVSIHSESSGNPETLVHTLTTPASISQAVTTFTAPSGATLAAGTTYYVVIATTDSAIYFSRTDATAEDTGGASGWSIADDRRFSQSGSWHTASAPIRMRVNGAADALVTKVPANWSLVPTGLQEGDQFRLLFISSAHRSASPSNIASYNTWIQDLAADGHTDIQDYSSIFMAVGSTEDYGRPGQHRHTYTSSDKGVAIYWLNGGRAADEYEDFYDGTGTKKRHEERVGNGGERGVGVDGKQT